MLNKIQKFLAIFLILFVIAIVISNVSFAATDAFNFKKTSGFTTENNYKGIASDLKIKTFTSDKDLVNGNYFKNNKMSYTFSTKKKNYKIKTISVLYEYYDTKSDRIKRTTKVYNGKNKKTLTINIPQYHKNVFYYHHRVLKYTINYSNYKKESNKKFFSSQVLKHESRIFKGKKTTITRFYKVSRLDIVGDIKYTIKANKKNAKIKKIYLTFRYSNNFNFYGPHSTKFKLKTITINGKGKNRIVKNISNQYDFYSAKIKY
ncbi:hypothetical protein [Methanobrevibacter curvatus]|uniref:Uncharacterized protein n=1 Tax=Methanobrevibacter curvatus TaxID=49547 RepID=A0A166AIN8_9EURY|nr:hypothetical protein [Methanobrevibacter curvatus]KZX12079.1 hypothetical protein MBCUR_11820 [Methanobrevibacter curvatus]